MDFRIYLDVNVLIAAYETDEHISDLVWQLFDKALTTGQVTLITSELSLSEALVKPFRDKADDLVKLYQDLMAADGPITVRPVSREILIEAALQRSTSARKEGTRLILADFIHSATASMDGCELVPTADKRFPAVGDAEVQELDGTVLISLLDRLP